jgi:hypothetical protein
MKGRVGGREGVGKKKGREEGERDRGREGGRQKRGRIRLTYSLQLLTSLISPEKIESYTPMDCAIRFQDPGGNILQIYCRIS